MKFLAGILVGVAATVVAGVTALKASVPAVPETAKQDTAATGPHAVTVYQGYNYPCDRPSNHKKLGQPQHHAVLPKGWDPYFQDFYWE